MKIEKFFLSLPPIYRKLSIILMCYLAIFLFLLPYISNDNIKIFGGLLILLLSINAIAIIKKFIPFIRNKTS